MRNRMMCMSAATTSGWFAFTGGRLDVVPIPAQSVLVAALAGITRVADAAMRKCTKAQSAVSVYADITHKPVRSWWVHPLRPPGST